MSRDALVTDQSEVAACAEKIAASGTLGFDLEFVSEGRYVPDLALMQIKWGDGEDEAKIIDCVATSPEPVLALLEDPAIETIAHSARQDLGLLFNRFGTQCRNLFDTQIAAAFVGLGDQVGLAKLLEKLLRVQVDKSQQYTKWLKRPLSPAQLAYALSDVEHLLTLRRLLGEKLEKVGRLGWVQEESDKLCEASATVVSPDEAYLNVKGFRGVRGASFSRMARLARWRAGKVAETNKPPAWLIPDRTLIEIAKRKSVKNVRDLRNFRGMPENAARRWGEEILVALNGSDTFEPPANKKPASLSVHGQVSAQVISAIVALRCQETGIAPRFVSTRETAEQVAAWIESGEKELPAIELLHGWRAELAGNDVLAWLRGEVAVKRVNGQVIVAAG